MRLQNSGDACEDLVGALGPGERLGIFVVDVQILANGAFELKGAAMRAALDLALADQSEPALDEVEPGAHRHPGRWSCCRTADLTSTSDVILSEFCWVVELSFILFGNVEFDRRSNHRLRSKSSPAFPSLRPRSAGSRGLACRRCCVDRLNPPPYPAVPESGGGATSLEFSSSNVAIS